MTRPTYRNLFLSVALVAIYVLGVNAVAAQDHPGAGTYVDRRPKIVSGGVLNRKAITRPEPVYPAAARQSKASGAVSVQVLVDEAGNVIKASVISGHPKLREAAATAARKAKFKPTLLSGVPVKVSGVITYNFVLQ